MKHHLKIILILLTGILNACGEKQKANENQEIVVTEIKVKDSPLSERAGKNIMISDNPDIKDCFLSLSESALNLPVSYRLQMLQNYEIRDILRHKQKMDGDNDSLIYDFEIDHLDSIRDYMMFSVFNDDREINYFLRYFRDTTDSPSHVIGLSKIEKKGKIRNGGHLFLAQTDSLIAKEDSLFPVITLRDFIEERLIQKLSLTPEEIENPPLLVWMPNKGEKIGIDLNLDGFGDKKTAVKSSCRRTHIDVTWLSGEGSFEKENQAPVVRKYKKPNKRKPRAKTAKKARKRK